MSEFVDYVQEVFAPLGVVRVRKMFGGYGLFYADVMFALIADDTLYLKSDAAIESYFSSRGLDQFTYDKRGKPVKMSYFTAPEEIFEDAEQALTWARRSVDAALRGKKK